MEKVITENIINAAKVSLEAGQAKYRAYFIKYPWYAAWQQAVDTRLTAAGYKDCIVTK